MSKGAKKKAYVDKNGLFALYGNGVVFQPHLLPLYSDLIKIHDNVVIGRNVELVTHDVLHCVFNASNECRTGYKEYIGCIEIMQNSFLGNGVIVTPGVRIAENNIIAAGAVVTKSTEPNGVYAGVPAKKIGVYSETARKRWEDQESGRTATVAINQRLTAQESANAWRAFYEQQTQMGEEEK